MPRSDRTVENNFIVIKANKDSIWQAVNLTSLLDSSLSYKAKALHIYLCTRPDKWQINIPAMVANSSDGEAAIRAGIQELLEKQYLYRATLRDENNHISKWFYIVNQQPASRTTDEIFLFLENLKIGNLNLDIRPHSIGIVPIPIKEYSKTKELNIGAEQKPLRTSSGKFSMAQSARQRAESKRRTPDPAIDRIVQYFSNGYRRDTGKNYPINPGRDHKAAKDAVTKLGEDEAKLCIDFFLTSAEMEWTRTNRGLTLSIALSQVTVTKYHNQSIKKPRRTRSGRELSDPTPDGMRGTKTYVFDV